MGIPKFYRWLSERYPLISQVVGESSIPEFDHFYLDMNSIIHKCSHPSDEALSHLTDEEIFTGIFEYLEKLFLLIRPSRLFYLAVDGIAPRAKMNQQRSRRFRTAQETATKLRESTQKSATTTRGHPSNRNKPISTSETVFDSNCITPGTAFMTLLNVRIQQFISHKVHSDPIWQRDGLQIIFSGSDVPGEGEHKIMEYIRVQKYSHTNEYEKSKPLRHCIYGLDADLIMLGLIIHEPHVALLREQVTFGKKGGNKTVNLDEKFDLLHLSLLREYLDLEFKLVFDTLSFSHSSEKESETKKPQIQIKYDLERVIDDFIFLAIFIGNDFVPQLPALHIHSNAFVILFEVYKNALPSMNDYLHHSGKVHWGSLSILIDELAKWELRLFIAENMEEVEKNIERPIEQSTTTLEFDDNEGLIIDTNGHGNESELDIGSEVSDVTYARALSLYEATHASLISSVSLSLALDTSSSPPPPNHSDIQAGFSKSKREYYLDKLEFDLVREPDRLESLTRDYMGILQWVLKYYYEGVPDWGYFFPWHYTPKISDVSLFLLRELRNKKDSRSRLDKKFVQGEPFRPLQQLLAVLPPASIKLVPEAYHDLILNPASPLALYYPKDFKMDLNGKKNEWEAIVCIPFIDAPLLLSEMEKRECMLSEQERVRNAIGENLAYWFKDSARVENLRLPECKTAVFLPRAIHPTGKENEAGFPSLYYRQFTVTLEKASIKVFNLCAPSINESIILRIINVPTSETTIKWLGRTVYIGYPFKREGIVTKIWTATQRFEPMSLPCHSGGGLISKDSIFYQPSADSDTILSNPLSDRDMDSYTRMVENSTSLYQRRYGIRFEGEGIVTLVYVRETQGTRLLRDGSVIKVYSEVESAVPVQLVMMESSRQEQRMEEKKLSLETLFKAGETVLYDSQLWTLCKVHQKSGTADLEDQAREESGRDEEKTVMIKDEFKSLNAIGMREYLSTNQVAGLLGITTKALSRLTSSYLIFDEGTPSNNAFGNIGLGLKFDHAGMKVPDYTLKYSNTWYYSPRSVALLQEYKEVWGGLLTILNSLWGLGKDKIYIDMLEYLGWTKKRLMNVVRWIKEKKKDVSTKGKVAIQVDTMSEENVKRLMQSIDEQYMGMKATAISKDAQLSKPKIKIRVSMSELVLPKALGFYLGTSGCYTTPPSLSSAKTYPLGSRVRFVADMSESSPHSQKPSSCLPGLGSLGTIIATEDERGIVGVLWDLAPFGNSQFRTASVPVQVLRPLKPVVPMAQPHSENKKTFMVECSPSHDVVPPSLQSHLPVHQRQHHDDDNAQIHEENRESESQKLKDRIKNTLLEMLKPTTTATTTTTTTTMTATVTTSVKSGDKGPELLNQKMSGLSLLENAPLSPSLPSLAKPMVPKASRFLIRDMIPRQALLGALRPSSKAATTTVRQEPDPSALPKPPPGF